MTVSFSSLELWGIFTPLMLAILAIGGLVLEMTFYRNRPRAVGIYTFLGMIVILVFQFGLHAYRMNPDPRLSYPFLVIFAPPSSRLLFAHSVVLSRESAAEARLHGYSTQ